MIKTKRIYWTVYMGVFIMGVLAAAIIPWLDYTFDLTNSLPDTLYVIHKDGEAKKGELIIYRWHDGATCPAGTTSIRRVVGVAGDTIKRAGSAFWVNDRYIGTVKPLSKAGVPLQPAQEGVVGAEKYFVSTPNPNSPDPRYALTGSVRQVEVIGRAYEIF